MLIEKNENIQTKTNNKKENQEKIKIFEKIVYELNCLITKQKKSFINKKHKADIIRLLNKVVTSHENANLLMEVYLKHNKKSLIEDLKELTNSYAGIKEYLLPFIDLKILKKDALYELNEELNK